MAPKSNDKEAGLSPSERQWLQIEKYQSKDETPFIDWESLRDEMRSWKFPLHFIDFETSRVAIPFNRGRRPYEQIAFQFSHHITHENGRIEHKGQYINLEKGKFPNFDFVRALKRELETDQGTIFRYATHENSILCDIYRQLRETETSLVSEV